MPNYTRAELSGAHCICTCCTFVSHVNSVLLLQRGWNLKTDNFYHFVHEEKTQDETIPSTNLAQQAIEYARELEMIV